MITNLILKAQMAVRSPPLEIQSLFVVPAAYYFFIIEFVFQQLNFSVFVSHVENPGTITSFLYIISCTKM